MSKYSRYSHHARRTLTHAGLLVKRFRHPRMDTGHLLVGVMLTHGSIGYHVLTALGLSADSAAEQLQILTLPLAVAPEMPPNDAALDIALELAADESNWLGHHYIGTEHLLLGITRTNIGNAGDLLRVLGVPSDQVRRKVRAALNEGFPEDTLQLARRSARLSELSRRVINAAEQMAVSLDHETVGIGHLLLVLKRERRALTARLLTECALDEPGLELFINQHENSALVSIEDVLLEAVEYAQRLGMHYTGTEHLLMGLLAHPAGEYLLLQCAVDPQRLSILITEQINSHK